MGDPIIDPCLVCGGPTKGIQCQVIACRGCASFYRRSIKEKKKYRCDGGAGNCRLERGSYLCRFCRFKRCKQVGMVAEKDKHSSTESLDLTPMQQESSTPHNDDGDFEFLSKIITEKLKITIDVQPIEQQLVNILTQTKATPIEVNVRLTSIQQLFYGFSKILELFKPKGDLIEIKEFDLYTHVKFYERFIVELAKTLMYCKQYAELPINDKVLLYKHVRRIIYDLERTYTSVLFFGTNLNDLRMLHDDQTYIDYVKAFRLKGFKTEDLVGALPYWMKIREKVVDYLIKPMKILQLTQYEMVYLLAHTLWNNQEVHGLSNETLRISEDLSQQIASELHDYYTYDMKLENYALRLTKIMKLIDAAKEIELEKQEISVMSRLFDIFHIDTDPLGGLCD